MRLRYNDYIYVKGNNFGNFVENFLYVEALSPKLGCRRYEYFSQTKQMRHFPPAQSTHWKAVALTAVKISLYCLLPLLPLAALGIKLLYRRSLPREAGSCQQISAAAKPILANGEVERIPNSSVDKSINLAPYTDFFPYTSEIALPVCINKGIDIRERKWLSNVQLYKLTSILFNNANYALYSPLLCCGDLEDACEAVIDNEKKRDNEFYPNYLSNHVGDYAFFACPILVSDNHWTLLFIDYHNRSIEYYDSKCNYGNHAEIKSILEELAGKLSQENVQLPPYSFACKIKDSIQPDSYQCGVWYLYLLQLRLTHPEVDINDLPLAEAQNIIRKYRVYLQKLLLDKQ